MYGAVRTVSLQRNDAGSFGFTVIGPCDAAADNSHVEGVYVKEVTSAAPIDAGLFIGDRILSINEQDVTCELADPVIDRMAALDSMRLTVENNPRALAMLEVERRGAGHPRLVTVTNVHAYGLGLDLIHTLDKTQSGPAGLQVSRTGSVPVYVAAIDRAGAVGRDGRIKAADQVLVVNGTPVASPDHASSLLSSPTDTVAFVVRASDEGFEAIRQVLLHTTSDMTLSGPVLSFHLPASGRLGLKMAGGCDTQFGGVFVSEVKPNSVGAELDVQPGDLVLSLGTAGMLKRSRNDMAALFHSKAHGSQLRLMRVGQRTWDQYRAQCERIDVARPGLPPVDLSFSKGRGPPLRSTGPIVPVTIYRKPNESCGVGVIGGLDQDMDAFFVSKVERTGPSFGILQPGDRILEVCVCVWLWQRGGARTLVCGCVCARVRVSVCARTCASVCVFV